MGSPLEIEGPAGVRRLSFGELQKKAREGRIRVGDLLAEDPISSHASFESSAGDYRASIPLEVARRQGVVILEHDGSLRLRVEDGETLCWNVKDLGRIRPTVGPEPDSIPADPPH